MKDRDWKLLKQIIVKTVEESAMHMKVASNISNLHYKIESLQKDIKRFNVRLEGNGQKGFIKEMYDRISKLEIDRAKIYTITAIIAIALPVILYFVLNRFTK